MPNISYAGCPIVQRIS